jgi:CCR4-NOT transcription complex subunit 4
LVSTTDPRTSGSAPTDDHSDGKTLIKAERKGVKKAAATEKAVEKQLLAQEKAAAKAAEKAKAAQEKAAEKERAAAEKAQQEKLQKEQLKKAKAAKEKVLQAEKDKLEKERAAKEAAAQVEREKATQGKKAVPVETLKPSKRSEPIVPLSSSSSRQSIKATTPAAVAEPPSQVPLLSKRPKKNKPGAKPIRIPKEEEIIVETPVSSTSVLETAHTSIGKPIQVSESSSNNSRAQSVDHSISLSSDPTSVEELLEEIDVKHPVMDLANHPFFDLQKINPAGKMPLEYGPLVHALSALSVSGGSFANNMPSGSIDNAVSSFQQLLETLTQTISDLLRLLPRTTWDDSSSFDGVLRDMLKGDDFLDDGGEDGPCKEDEVAALTLALERRARWMEVQLSKLEELHRDINTAAVRAVLSFNDNGWDRRGVLPRVGNTLRRFDSIGMIEEAGKLRLMSADELEKKLTVAKEAVVFAETEVREIMERMQAIKPIEVEI